VCYGKDGIDAEDNSENMKKLKKSDLYTYIQESRIIRTTLLLFVLFILSSGYGIAREKKVKEKQANPKVGLLSGVVVDGEFDEPIEKAVVTIPGTLISVLTNQQGKYAIKLVGGDYLIEVNHPGYFGKKYNMSVSAGISTPMFIVKLKANAVGRTVQRRLTSYENKTKFPQTLEDFSYWKVREQSGNQEFNELLRTIPSVSFYANGSGFNDSEIGFRGNDPAKTSYTLDGIVLNNPETGKVGSPMLSGLTDWAQKIQITSGQSGNLQSQIQSGGLVNVLSLVPQEKSGAEISAIYGNQGFLKTSATVYSGLSKKKLASTIHISRTSGNGLTQNSAFEQYSIFLNVQKEINHFHTLALGFNGVIQQHDRNFSDSIGAYNLYGPKYNPDWGTLNKKPVSWSTNFARSPLVSLTHFWQPRIKTHITTQLFAQFNRSAQLFPGGSFNNRGIKNVPRDSAGHVSFTKITDWNKGLAVPEMGTNRIAASDGKFVNTENSGITTLAATNSENRFGLRSVINHNFNKKLDLSGSFNLESYQAKHFGSVHDLLGADNYSSFSDINRPEGYQAENLFNSGFFPAFNSAQKVGYFYESSIQTGGLSMRLKYQTARFIWDIEGSASVQAMSRTDHFNYTVTDPERQTKSALMPDGHAQTGIKFNFWKYHSIHLRTSYGSYQPLFASLFPAGTNWNNPYATNEQVFDAEAGYTIFSRRLKVEALAYWSSINNRSEIRKSNLTTGYILGMIDGLQEIHQGIELKSSYKLTKNLQLNLNGSYGDWKYSADATARLLNELQTTDSKELLIKNIPVTNAPQMSLFAEVDYRWAHNFYVRINYYRADRIFAPFGLSDFENLTDRKDFKQWQLPAYQLLGVSGNYLLKVGKSQHLNFIFGGNNLLDSEYIEQSTTNIPEGNPNYTSNQVYYGMGRTWFVGLKFQF